MPEAGPNRLIPGQSVGILPGLRRVLAPNPSALTGPGTNSYIVGEGRVALIDPGPADPAHLAALLAALAPGERVEVIVVTHAHTDHSALSAMLARQVGAPVLAFGTAKAGRNPDLAGLEDLGGGEGADHAFVPDVIVKDGEMIRGPDWSLGVIHTPGHFGNHICLTWGDVLFSGDHAMGWSTSLVSPPDGDMTAYMRSLARLQRLGPRTLLPGHGAEVPDAPARLEALLVHRHAREAQILAALAHAPGTAQQVAGRVYTDVNPGLLPAATRNVLAHLLDLHARSKVGATPRAGVNALWQLP